MYLKSDKDIAKAMHAKAHADVPKERKEQLVATLRAAHPDKRDELHIIFVTDTEGGLTKAERAFYLDCVEVDGNETINAQPPLAQGAVNATPPGATNGSEQ